MESKIMKKSEEENPINQNNNIVEEGNIKNINIIN